MTRKKLPNVYKSCQKIILLEKLKILIPLHKLPKNVGDLGKLIVVKGFKSCRKNNESPNLVTLPGAAIAQWIPLHLPFCRPGSSPKQTIYALSIYIWIVSCGKRRKRGRNWSIFKKYTYGDYSTRDVLWGGGIKSFITWDKQNAYWSYNSLWLTNKVVD